MCKILPDLLLSAMEIIYKKYTSLKSKTGLKFSDGNDEDKLKFLREQAKAITVMAATVPAGKLAQRLPSTAKAGSLARSRSSRRPSRSGKRRQKSFRKSVF